VGGCCVEGVVSECGPCSVDRYVPVNDRDHLDRDSMSHDPDDRSCHDPTPETWICPWSPVVSHDDHSSVHDCDCGRDRSHDHRDCEIYHG